MGLLFMVKTEMKKVKITYMDMTFSIFFDRLLSM